MKLCDFIKTVAAGLTTPVGTYCGYDIYHAARPGGVAAAIRRIDRDNEPEIITGDTHVKLMAKVQHVVQSRPEMKEDWTLPPPAVREVSDGEWRCGM